jgi:hypothetical protein
MAATDIQRARYGFQWLRSLSGGNNSHPPIEYGQIASAYTFTPTSGNACGIRVGDLVRQASGLIVLARGFENTSNVAESVLGVVAGLEYLVDGAMIKSDRMPSGGGVYGSNLALQTRVAFIPVLGQVFAACLDEAHADVDTEAELRALQGSYIDSILDTSATDYVNPLLDASSTSGSDGQFRILGPEKIMTNVDISAANFRLEVTINEAQRSVG